LRLIAETGISASIAAAVMTKKVALVTGASSGIGEATARQLQKAGFIVYGAARRTDRMSDLAASGVHTLARRHQRDLGRQRGRRDHRGEGRIDVLVNNAGYGSYGALEDVPMEEARAQIEVNVFGLARLTQLVLPHMRAQRSGTIVNISSMGGRFATPMGAWYHASKYAVEGLSDALRLEVKRFGIDVVLIEPGSIRTDWGAIAAGKLRATSGRRTVRRAGRRDGQVPGAKLAARRPHGLTRHRHRQGRGQGGDRPASAHPLPRRFRSPPPHPPQQAAAGPHLRRAHQTLVRRAGVTAPLRSDTNSEESGHQFRNPTSSGIRDQLPKIRTPKKRKDHD
jgi:short-subunit dehydrogenase